jgi:hypothetical protein
MIAAVACCIPYIYTHRHPLPEAWLRVHHYLLVTYIVTSDWKVAPYSTCSGKDVVTLLNLLIKRDFPSVGLPTQGVTSPQTCLHKHNVRVIVKMYLCLIKHRNMGSWGYDSELF